MSRLCLNIKGLSGKIFLANECLFIRNWFYSLRRKFSLTIFAYDQMTPASSLQTTTSRQEACSCESLSPLFRSDAFLRSATTNLTPGRAWKDAHFISGFGEILKISCKRISYHLGTANKNIIMFYMLEWKQNQNLLHEKSQ